MEKKGVLCGSEGRRCFFFDRVMEMCYWMMCVCARCEAVLGCVKGDVQC